MAEKAPRGIPEGMNTVTPYLTFQGKCTSAIEFYQKTLGAKLVGGVAQSPDGKILHAMMKLGDSNVMLSDSFEPMQPGSPMITLWVYVDDADLLYNQAVNAGCEATMKIEDMFWGDRLGQVKDPYGHLWSIASQKWILTPEEMEKGQQEWLRSAGM